VNGVGMTFLKIAPKRLLNSPKRFFVINGLNNLKIYLIDEICYENRT
jgi:hypothetical protein